MPVTVRVVVEEVENGMKMRARSNKTGPVPIEGELDGYIMPAELKEKTPPQKLDIVKKAVSRLSIRREGRGLAMSLKKNYDEHVSALSSKRTSKVS